jgi:uncharacterized damage-inducible protein DinB
MDKSQLFEAIHAARAEWEGLVAVVDPSHYKQSGVSGHWSLKDVIAHISWFEREVAHALRTRSYADSSEWWLLPWDERNAHIYDANRDRMLTDVLADSKATYADLLSAIDTLSDEDLNDAARFEYSPPGALPWEIIAQNSYEHYQHHGRDLRAWLERTV